MMSSAGICDECHVLGSKNRIGLSYDQIFSKPAWESQIADSKWRALHPSRQFVMGSRITTGPQVIDMGASTRPTTRPLLIPTKWTSSRVDIGAHRERRSGNASKMRLKWSLQPTVGHERCIITLLNVSRRNACLEHLASEDCFSMLGLV